MSVTPVGHSKLMKRQEVRGVYSTDFSSLLKLALAPMSPTPKHQVETEQLNVGQGTTLQQNKQPQQQAGVGGQFVDQGAEKPEQSDQTTQVDPEKKNQQEEEYAQQQSGRAKQIRDGLIKKIHDQLGMNVVLTNKKVERNGMTGFSLVFDTKATLVDEDTGNVVPANEVLQPIFDWADSIRGLNYTNAVVGAAGNRAIGGQNAKMLHFEFSYLPEKMQEQEQDEVTTFRSRGGQPTGRVNSRMGNPPSKDDKVFARTLPELLSLRKKALVETLSKYVVSGDRT